MKELPRLTHDKDNNIDTDPYFSCLRDLGGSDTVHGTFRDIGCFYHKGYCLVFGQFLNLIKPFFIMKFTFVKMFLYVFASQQISLNGFLGLMSHYCKK